ncbi:MAG: phosphoenolpyruvate carboxykinase (GTP), partial [Candidatus Eisenbacteria bacterium]|nr:phosphoenolpyruvate carboxykinase (GTP) [Candidatus Eisenbacteria bacterium]
MDELSKVDVEGWTAQLAEIKKHYEKFGAKLPQGLKDELASLEKRLQSAGAKV